ncbi:MAG: hypothetical protein O7E52_23970 [Candidatus Poribacteria bacterium]|nr:hypothetical protein [Candidatus Poribacteria bacterium]
MKVWNQRDNNESAQAYSAFRHYLELPFKQRSVDAAYRVYYEAKHGQSIGKRKKAPGTWTMWMGHHEWTDRAQAFDTMQQKKALIRTANRRQKDVEQFVEADMMLSLGFQRISSRKVAMMMKQDPVDVNASELRQIALAYDTARSWLTDLLGIFDDETNPLSNLAITDEALAQQLQEESL